MLAIVDDPAGSPEDRKDAGALLGLGLKLLHAGEADAGMKVVERVVTGRRGDPKVALLGAMSALENGDHWLSAAHAAVVIGQRPLEAEGYYYAGLGMLRAGQAAAAVEFLKQGPIVAPLHVDIMDALDEALIGLNRAQEAEAWAALRPAECPIGGYFTLDTERLGARSTFGRRHRPDGTLELAGGAASIRLYLAEFDAAELSVTLDLAVHANGAPNERIPLALSASGIVIHAEIDPAGPPIQTLHGQVPAAFCGPSRAPILTLDFPLERAHAAALQPIGVPVGEG